MDSNQAATDELISSMIRDMRDVFGDAGEQAAFLRRMKRAIGRQIAPATSEEHIANAFRVHAGTFPFCVENLYPLSQTSATARRLLTGRLAAVRGEEFLDAGCIEAAAKAYALALKIGSFLVSWDHQRDILSTLTLFDSLGNDETAAPEIRADSLLVKATLCSIQGYLDEGVVEIRRAQQLNPQDGALHALEGCTLAMQLNKRRSLAAFRRAADLGHDDIEDTLFHQAIIMEHEPKKMTQLLEQYVTQAERDARKFPEACYRLAMLYGTKGPVSLGKARRFYDLGLEGDEKRLPVFADECAAFRRQAQALLSKYHACGRLCCTVLATNICPCKLVWYCSRECQSIEWKNHRQLCKETRKKQKQVNLSK